MNAKDTQQNNPVDGNPADQNVERLLSDAYRPEEPHAEFVCGIETALRAAAARRREERESELSGHYVLPSGDRLLLRPWQILLGWGVAISLLAAVVYVTRPGPTREQVFHRDGRVIWHGGIPYVMSDATREEATGEDATAGGAKEHRPPAAADSASSVGQHGLRASARPVAPQAKAAAIGETIATRRGERRRVALPDGSVLHVNENTTLKLEGQRGVSLASGQVFLEVNPAHASTAGEKFLVKTPRRELSALGTKFAVNVGRQGTGVVVVQGQVKASDVEAPLVAGQQLGASQSVVAAAPRAAHLLDWTKPLLAAADLRLVPESKHGGGSLVAIDPNGQEASLSLRKYHVDVHIEDGFARTTIDQTYFNHTPSRLEGTFHFPLPPDASLSRLAMYVGPTLMEGGMVERDYGRQVFETIKYRMLDPALLEWVDGSTFKMRVFPLEGRQEKRIILSYTQRLDVAYDRTQYRFPAGHSLREVRDWSLKIHVQHGAGLAWQCDSHELSAATPGDDLVLTAAAKHATPDRDIVLSLQSGAGFQPASEESSQPSAPSGQARFSAYNQDGWRYLMLRYCPDLTTPPQRARRDWVFLVEASADRSPLLARAQIEIVRHLLENAEHDDTFRLLSAGTHATCFADGPRANTPDNIAAGVQFLESAHLVGALDLDRALATAQPLLASAANPVLVHVGSGVSVLGQRDTDKLLKRLDGKAMYVGIGVGKRWNRQFMRQAATRTGGYFTQINPDEQIPWRAFELLSTLSAARLLDLKVSAKPSPGAASATFLNLNDSLADGEELCAVTRVPAGQPFPPAVQVAGRLGGEPFVRDVPVRDVRDGAGYLPRTWAKQEIDRLVAENAQKHREQIIALSKAMYVMSPFTSLLVLENEEMYTQFKVDRGRKDHWAMYPAPAKIEVVHEPIAGPEPQSTPAAQPKAKDKPTKPSAGDILDTILVRVPPRLLKFAHDRNLRGTWPVAQVDNVAFFGSERAMLLDYLNKPPVYLATVGMQAPGVFSADLDIRSQPDFDALIELITTTVRPEAWQEVGGPGSISSFEGNLSLVISQTTDVHDEIADLLAARRAYRFQPLPSPRQGTQHSPRPQGPWHQLIERRQRLAQIEAAQRFQQATGRLTAPSLAELRILRELAEPTQIDFEETRLRDVIAHLRDRHGLNIEFNRKALEAAGVNPDDVRITRRLSDVSLRSSLKLMLEQLGLAYVIKNECVVVTSKEDADAYLITKVNSVADLVVPLVPSRFDIASAAMNATMQRAVADGIFLRQGRIRGVLATLRETEYSLIPQSDAPPLTFPSRAEWERLLEQNKQLRAELSQYHTLLQDSSSSMRPDDQPTVYGLVQAVNNARGLVEVSVGFDDGMEVGTELDVFRHGTTEGGTQYVGRITLTTVHSDISVGQVLRDYSKATIVRGDHVATRLSHTDGSEAFLAHFAARLERQPSRRDLLYQRPRFSGDPAVFSDLLAYAPGMNTTWDDVLSVLEAEAQWPEGLRRGKVEAAARELIEKARRGGWQTVTWPGKDGNAKDGNAKLVVQCDGQGRYRYERATLHGLKEQVVCDGQNLWHLYPELSVGAKRPLSRFHRGEFAALVPWAVLPADDYAVGADVRLENERTVAIIPHGIEAAKGKDGKPLPHVRLLLTFSTAGQLAERKLVLAPEGRTLQRVTYAADGTVRGYDEKDKRLDEYRLAVKRAAEVDVTPSVAQFVVLPLPLRSRDHVMQTAGSAKQEKKQPKSDKRPPTPAPTSQFANWSEDDALRLLAADLGVNDNEVQEIIAARFFRRGDRRLGFYTLLLAAKGPWPLQEAVRIDGGEGVRMDPLADHPDSPLARYIAEQVKSAQKDKKLKDQGDEPESPLPPNAGFLEYLAKFRRWHRALPMTNVQRAAGWEKNFLEHCPSPYLAWAVLDRAAGRADRSDAPLDNKELARHFERLKDSPLSYFARYELARCRGDRQLFVQLFRETIARGGVPALDADFLLPVRDRDEFTPIRETALSLVREGRYLDVIDLAWQCQYLEKAPLADSLFDIVLTNTRDDDRLVATAAAIELYWNRPDFARAERLLAGLLKDKRLNPLPAVWRLAAVLAGQRGQHVRQLEYLEQALLRTYTLGKAPIDLEQYRADHRDLLSRYRRLAANVADLGPQSGGELAARLVRAADRWRELDDDPTEVCQLAAEVLSALGHKELAWSYVTSPLALRPHEGGPWSAVAHQLQSQGELDLAERAYTAAFEAEGSNPRHLWDRAQLLQQQARFAEARRLYQQIAEGKWPPQHESLKRDARQIAGGMP